MFIKIIIIVLYGLKVLMKYLFTPTIYRAALLFLKTSDAEPKEVTTILVDSVAGGHHFTYISKFAHFLDRKEIKIDVHFPLKIENANSFCFEEKFWIPKRLGKIGRFLLVLERWHYLIFYIMKSYPSNKGVQIFLMWGDNYAVSGALMSSVLDKIIPFKWSALIFQPSTKKSDYYLFRTSNCKSVYSTVETSLPIIQSFFPSIRAYYFPDFIDIEIDEAIDPNINKMIQNYQGEQIISLVGSIAPRKGVLAFFELASYALERKLPYKFILAGTLITSAFSEQQLIEFNSRLNLLTKNNILQSSLSRISNESSINTLIQTSGVIWAAYENFQYSSNMLSKSSYFATPILCTKGSYIAQMSEKYKLGVSVDLNNVESIALAIALILKKRSDYVNLDYYHKNTLEQCIDIKVFSK